MSLPEMATENKDTVVRQMISSHFWQDNQKLVQKFKINIFTTHDHLAPLG